MKNMLKIAHLLTVALLTVVSANAGVYDLGQGRFATDTETIEVPLDKAGLLEISSSVNLSGKLTIIVDTLSAPRLEYRKILKTSSESKALEYSAVIVIELNVKPGGVNLVLRSPNPAPWSKRSEAGMVELAIYLPEYCRVDIDAAYFDVTINGPLSYLANRESLGRMTIEKIYGELNITGSNRKLWFRDISGDISIRGRNADIKIENIESVETPALLRNEGGDIRMIGGRGIIDIKNSFGRINLNEVGFEGVGSRIWGIQCPIKMEIMELRNATLSIENSFEDTEILMPTDLSATLNIRAEDNGEIHLTGIPFKPETIGGNHAILNIGTGSSTITIIAEEGGNIEIEGI
jgi:hypothetical protein